MSNKEKLSYKYKRRTLKGRLQRSLTTSSFLSIAISLISILMLLSMLITPIGHFLTDSISNRIYRNYVFSPEGMNKYTSIEETLDNVLTLDEMDLTFDEILEMTESRSNNIDINEVNENFQAVRKSFEENDDNAIKVWGDIIKDVPISDDEKKSILLSVYNALETTDSFLTVSQYIGIDWVNITLIVNDEVLFSVPIDYNMNDQGFASKKFDDINSTLKVVDKYGNEIGTLVTSLNLGIIGLVTFPVVFMFLMIAFMTFIIVKILLLPSIYRLMQPITTLNNELRKITEYDSIEGCDIKIEQKNPPTEIKALIDYSNTIISKLQESYHSLENVNDELEAQNEELDAQKDELEAQNHQLMISGEKLRQAQSQLVQSEKLASMGQLTAAIMHEINTPMGAVKSNNQIIDMMLAKLNTKIEDGDIEDAKKIVEKLIKSNQISVDAANRVNEIIRNLKNFSRIDQAEFQKANIIEGFKSVLVLTSNLWKNKVIINEDYLDMPEIECYPSMINQVFMNLIVNAIQAIDGKGQIDIKTYKEDNHIYIEVKDDGTGIKESDLQHLFDDGFTTKPKDEGTGLGLSISKNIIDKHNGIIEAYNNEEKGATFKITLPIKQN